MSSLLSIRPQVLQQWPRLNPALLLKRALDVVLSASALVALFPLLVTVGLLVKATSPGPAVYAAPRAGRRGQTFICYKFRTMIEGADDLKAQLRGQNERDGPFFKIANDPRVNRVGRFLRRYSLDELPQLWNVLKGDMSLVGPRPHPLDDFQRYDWDHRRRLRVTPGLTGLWQVTARTDPSFQRAIELDLEYIDNWSLGMDMKILLKTISAVWQGSGT